MARVVECPHCGAPIDARRVSCPECGSDAATGWRSSEDIDYESIELPDDEVVEGSSARPPSWIWIAALLALLGMAALALLR